LNTGEKGYNAEWVRGRSCSIGKGLAKDCPAREPDFARGEKKRPERPLKKGLFRKRKKKTLTKKNVGREEEGRGGKQRGGF